MSTTVSSHIELDDLVAATRGRVVASDDPDYPALTMPWNVAVASTPIAVVEALDASDVAATVRFAAGHGLGVTVQCTGHGAFEQDAPYLLVNTARMAEVSIDPSTRIARVGAGARWQHVLDAGAPHGLAAPAGSAPNVGVVGYLTGGGLSPLGRSLGWASDYVRAIEVVTGAGEVCRATPTEHADLFWGLRGGKGALGVVTALELELVELPTLFGGALFFAAPDVATVVTAWCDWTRALPEQASTSLAVLRLPPLPDVPPPLAGKVAVAVRFAWIGDPDDGAAVLAPLRACAPTVLDSVGVMPAAALGAVHMDPTDPMPVAEQATLLHELTPETAEAFIAAAGPESACRQVIVEMRLMGGALAAEAQEPGAIDFRDAAAVVMCIGIAAGPDAPATSADADAIVAGFAPWSTGRCLPNFRATADPQVVASKYAPETLQRLASLSERYDPAGVLVAGRITRAAASLA